MITAEGVLLTLVVVAIGIFISCKHDEAKASGKIKTKGDNSLRLARLTNQLLDIIAKYEGPGFDRGQYCWPCPKNYAASGYWIEDRWEQFLSEYDEAKLTQQDRETYRALKAEYDATREIQRAFISKISAGSRNAALNQALSQTDIPVFSGQAKEAVARDAATKARNDVIKGAVVGGAVAGKTGAVVGAVAAKAKQDAKKGKR